jgi:hypothetical protein
VGFRVAPLDSAASSAWRDSVLAPFSKGVAGVACRGLSPCAAY